MTMLRDILGERATVDLMEELNDLLEQLKVLGWKEIRPWGEFFGAFKFPESDSKQIEERVATNLLHYRSNYATICAVVVLVQILFAPMLIVAVPLAVILCLYILVVHKRPIKIASTTINQQGKATACAIFCLFFFAISGILERLIWIVIYCIFTCGLHVLLRPRTLTSKANKVYEEMKLNGATGWFGGFGDNKAFSTSNSASNKKSPFTSPTPKTPYAVPYTSAVSKEDYEQIDPENPSEWEQHDFSELAASTSSAAAPAVAPYGYSSNLSTGADVRKRGAPPSSGGYSAPHSRSGGASVSKHD